MRKSPFSKKKVVLTNSPTPVRTQRVLPLIGLILLLPPIW